MRLSRRPKLLPLCGFYSHLQARLRSYLPLAGPHNWLFFAITLPALSARLRQYARGKLLDIGCGEKPYQAMVAPYVIAHVGLDIPETSHDTSKIDWFGPAYEIPCTDESFDTILCTDVLEHLERPTIALAEAFRVLCIGGYAIYTVPFIWHIHEEPRDFFRFTAHGLRCLFEAAGFDVVEITPLSGFIATLAQELVYFLYEFRRGRWNPLRLILPIVAAPIQAFALLLNYVDPTVKYTMEYIAVVQKPSALSANAQV